ncbi:MAG: nicotinate-nucleotide adenylyltransferase [Acidaminococcaceae bacterium]
MNRKKLGIMGGTFDPIHNGHLETAEFVYQQLELDKIIFIPAYIAPHKVGIEVASAPDRFAMTVLATRECPHFTVSEMELVRQGISYTYDTVVALLEEYGKDYDLYLIIGADSVTGLDTWHRIEELLRLCKFVAATRPGFAPTVDKVIEYFGELGRTQITWLNTPEMDISSTDIRQRIRAQQAITGLVPPAVEQYILTKDLYR